MAIDLATMDRVMVLNTRRAFTDLIVDRLRPSPFFRYAGKVALSDADADALKAKIDAMPEEEFLRFAERVGKAMTDA